MMIRKYNPIDWDRICEIYNASKLIELEPSGLRDSFVPLEKDSARIAGFGTHTILVCELQDAGVIGFGGYRQSYIGWLFVAPSNFRQGVGRTLLRAMVSGIRGDCWLQVMKDNNPALALYSSEGFKVDREFSSLNNGRACTAVKLCREFANDTV